MEGYTLLKQYLETTKLIEIDKNFKLRLSDELLPHLENGDYAIQIDEAKTIIKSIDELRLRYPNDTKPIFYFYIVPDENFKELLNYPQSIPTKGGGKIVECFDRGATSAYGINSSMFISKRERNTSEFLNRFHELAHIVHNVFWLKDRFLCEGFAESLGLYTFGYEEVWKEHREYLSTLDKSSILSAKELIHMEERTGSFPTNPTSTYSCSFDLSYISSYLFVRGCLEHISEKNNSNRVEATQRFLEIVGNSNSICEWLVCDMAKSLELPVDTLLEDTSMQMKVIESIVSSLSKNCRKDD